MATGVNVKMGVTGVSEFKRSMKDSETAVRTLSEALKLNESQLKATGNQELYLQNKTKILQDQISKQTEVVKKANEALQAMKNSGVDPSSASFQQMQQKVYNATTKLLDMKSELNKVGTEAGTTSSELSKIETAVSWDNVAEGIGKITSQLKSAGQAAIRLGKQIYNSAKGSTGWADDLITLSEETDVDLVTLQKIDKVAHIIETDAEAIAQAKRKMANATQNNKGVESIEEVLGIKLNGQTADDLFWEIGKALANMGEEFDKESAAQKIFGRGWYELLPLFKMGREEYEKLLEDQTVLSEEDVRKLGQADDAMQSIEKEWAQMKNQFWADNADKITEMMTWLIDNKELVVGALTAIGGAFGALKLAELGANLMKVVSGFKTLGLLGGGAGAAGAASAGSAVTGAAAGGGAGGLFGKAGAIGLGAVLTIPTFQKLLTEGKRDADDIAKETAAIIGGQEVVDIYSKIQQQGLTRTKTSNPDWRPSYMQDQSYYGGPGRGDEVIHKDRRGVSTFDDYSDSLNRMASEAAQTSANTERIAQNSVTSADIQTLTGLPAAVAQAVTAGMASVKIVIGAGAVDAIGDKVNRRMAGQVQAMVQ